MDKGKTLKNGPEDKKGNDDADRLYASKKEGRRGPALWEDREDASILGFEDYIKK